MPVFDQKHLKADAFEADTFYPWRRLAGAMLQRSVKAALAGNQDEITWLKSEAAAVLAELAGIEAIIIKRWIDSGMIDHRKQPENNGGNNHEQPINQAVKRGNRADRDRTGRRASPDAGGDS